MILIAGGTGTLGKRLVPLLTEHGIRVRILTRNPERALFLQGPFVEILSGDVRDPHILKRAMDGINTAISAFPGFTGRGTENPQSVDEQGNLIFFQAAQDARVQHVALISILGAAPDHPLELFRMKYQAEQALQASGLSWSIIRSAAYMETWATLLCKPLLVSGRTMIFGVGRNPINFIAAADVARLVVSTVHDQTMQNRLINVGGPENLTMRQFAEIFAVEHGIGCRIRAIPVPALRITASIMQYGNPTLARQIQAAIVMDTTDMAFDVGKTDAISPSFTLSRWQEVARSLNSATMG